jgi:hypothetical protein
VLYYWHKFTLLRASLMFMFPAVVLEMVKMVLFDTFEVFSAVWPRTTFFWGMTRPNGLIESRRPEGMSCLHLQGSVRLVFMVKVVFRNVGIR